VLDARGAVLMSLDAMGAGSDALSSEAVQPCRSAFGRGVASCIKTSEHSNFVASCIKRSDTTCSKISRPGTRERPRVLPGRHISYRSRGNAPGAHERRDRPRESSRVSSHLLPRKHPVGARMSNSANVSGSDQRVLTEPEATLGRGPGWPSETALEGTGGPCRCGTRRKPAEKGPESIRVRWRDISGARKHPRYIVASSCDTCRWRGS
jgi:hypothetical protein